MPTVRPSADIDSIEDSDSDELSSSLTSIVTLDDILHYLEKRWLRGDFGLYQRMVSVMLMPFGFFNVFVYFGQMFMTLVPEEHWCRLPEVDGMSREEVRRRGIPPSEDVPYEGHELPFSRCWMYDVPLATLLSVQSPDPKWPMQRCHSWEFKFTSSDVPYTTIASELEWVCDKQYLVNLAQSIFFVGSIFGGILFGWMADKYGRIPVLVVANMFGFFAGMATVFARRFWHFGVCRFLVGFASDNNFTMMYILVLEYVGPKWRTWVANLSIAICFPLACCTLPWLALRLSNWKSIAIVTSAPLAFAVVTPIVVPESVRWLACQGRISEAIKIMRRIQSVNKTSVPDSLYADFKEDSENVVRFIRNEESRVLDLLRTPRLRRITILLIAIWGIIAMVFDGHIRNLGTMGLDIFFTFTISSATTFPADIFVAFALDYYGRRWLSFASMFLSGLACFFASMTSGVYFAAFGLVGRFLINISYTIGLQYAAELLPTVVRAKGVAVIHIFGYATAILSPFIAYTRIFACQVPVVVLGILSTIGGILCLFLPETLDQELSQTLQIMSDDRGIWLTADRRVSIMTWVTRERLAIGYTLNGLEIIGQETRAMEGEEFGKDQRFFDMPCLAPKQLEPKPNKHHLHAQRPAIRGEILRSSIISGAVGSKYRLSVWSRQVNSEGVSLSSRSNRVTFNDSSRPASPGSSKTNV
ncbi:solute carrier family 22 member 13-like [Neodiprion fabricii]|uniref:solute carrier family 22 member 13-like n=1 Tax=Neodiprion fabricii TaxID=2872261 RepID=UPI001ED95CA2|nr:solute carrier family 22 member 13-like [Neodiprion fabricii]